MPEWPVSVGSGEEKSDLVASSPIVLAAFSRFKRVLPAAVPVAHSTLAVRKQINR